MRREKSFPTFCKKRYDSFCKSTASQHAGDIIAAVDRRCGQLRMIRGRRKEKRREEKRREREGEREREDEEKTCGAKRRQRRAESSTWVLTFTARNKEITASSLNGRGRKKVEE
jgi:hypothetical protein